MPRHGAGGWDWVQFDLEGLRTAIRNATARVTERFRDTTDPSQGAHQLDWTISETAAHLVVVARANAGYAKGRAAPVLELDRLAETNRVCIDELPERDLHVLADALEESVEDLLATTAGREPAGMVPWHSRTELPLGGMFGIVLAELLVHGDDIAQAQKARWRIEAADAAHVVRGAFAFGPLVVDRDVAAARPISYRVRCSGVPTSIYRFANGALTVAADTGESVDCQMRLDPVTFMLVGFGRRSPIVAALQGRALSWGRRPLAAFRFPSYFARS